MNQTLAQNILCECSCKFAGRKCNFRQKSDNDKSQRACKKPIEHSTCKKDYAWNVVHVLVSLIRIVGLVNT